MTLKPCPNPLCRSEDVRRRLRISGGLAHPGQVYCSQCETYGPRKDPTGEKWNNLLRVEDVKAAFKDGHYLAPVDADVALQNSSTKRDLDRRMEK